MAGTIYNKTKAHKLYGGFDKQGKVGFPLDESGHFLTKQDFLNVNEDSVLKDSFYEGQIIYIQTDESKGGTTTFGYLDSDKNLVYLTNPQTTVIEAADLTPYDPTKKYVEDEYVSYFNLASPTPQFQVESIYRATMDLLAGVSPENTPSNWKYLGQELTTVSAANYSWVEFSAQVASVPKPNLDSSQNQLIAVYENGFVYELDKTSLAVSDNINVIFPSWLNEATDQGRWIKKYTIGGGGSGGHTIKDSSTTFTQRSGLKFTGDVIVSDDSEGNNTVVNIASTPSTLTVSNSIGLIELDKTRHYGNYTASEPFTLSVNHLTKKPNVTSSIKLFPNSLNVAIDTNFINMGTESLVLDQQNTISFGNLEGEIIYKIVKQNAYVDPQLPTMTLTATSSSESQIDFTWTNVPNNISTEIQISSDGTNWGSSIVLGADATAYQLTGLTLGTLRYGRGRYVGDGINYFTGDWSNIASTTTTNNQAPTVSSVVLTSTPTDYQVGNNLAISYLYSDTESNAENTTSNGTKYKINVYDTEQLAIDDELGTGGTNVFSGYTGGSPSPNDTITAGMVDKYPKGFIQPVALSGGNPGAWTGSNVGSQVIANTSYLSAQFTLSSGHFEFDSTSNLEFGNGIDTNLPRTYFFRTKDIDRGNANILEKGDTDSNYGISVSNNIGYFQFAAFDNSLSTNYNVVRSDVKCDQNVWNSVSLAWDGSVINGVTVYENNIIRTLAGTQSGVFASVPLGGKYYIGKPSTAPEYYVNEIIIIDKVITKAEHDALVLLKDGDVSELGFASNIIARIRFQNNEAIDLITPSRVISKIGTVLMTNDKP